MPFTFQLSVLPISKFSKAQLKAASWGTRNHISWYLKQIRISLPFYFLSTVGRLLSWTLRNRSPLTWIAINRLPASHRWGEGSRSHSPQGQRILSENCNFPFGASLGFCNQSYQTLPVACSWVPLRIVYIDSQKIQNTTKPVRYDSFRGLSCFITNGILGKLDRAPA